VDVIDELIANNVAAAAALSARRLDVRPSRQLAVVTCMDARLDVFAVSQRRLGTRAVMLIHHTGCGMQSLTDDGFRAELQQASGVAPAFAIESFVDVDSDVRQSILRVRRSPFLPHTDNVRGFVYDVERHLLREVDVAAASASS
jgi:carbonic anhydrase